MSRVFCFILLPLTEETMMYVFCGLKLLVLREGGVFWGLYCITHTFIFTELRIVHYGFYCCCFYQITDTVSKVNLKEALFCVDSELSSPSLTSPLSSLVTTVQQVVVKVVCYIYCWFLWTAIIMSSWSSLLCLQTFSVTFSQLKYDHKHLFLSD